MSNSDQSSNQTQNRPWAALWSVFLLAPLAMAPKGCDAVVIGDQCPDEMSCTAGSAGGEPVANAGAAGKPTGSGGSAGKPTTGAGGAGGDNICGGQLNRGCAPSEYCLYDVKTACGSGDQSGVCTPRPQACNDIYAPVCGCDSKTYSSECEAAARGFSVLHMGVCDEPSSGTSCGGLKPSTCAKSEFCNFPIGAMCGAADQTGTCTRIPDACDAVYDPVCGCDNVTYSSACTASAKGVSVAKAGACDTPTPGATCGGLLGASCPMGQFCDFPIETKCGSGDQTGTCTAIPNGCTKELNQVCGCDGNTYGNACVAASAGVAVAATGACGSSGKNCGGDLPTSCATDEYCNYPRTANCGRADAGGVCVKKLMGGCLANYDPVCGCDGKTYGNACEAGLAGVSIDTDGACP